MRQWEREVNSTTAGSAGMRRRPARTLTLSHAVLYGLGVTMTLIRIKMTEIAALPPGVFICPFWVPVADVIASAALLVIDVALMG
ncbi:hypothetical protein [Rhizobium leguminosarum]|uniref:hypothetical protein n=1 Tax=Rhizobium leguminosarum TaxID=384 RepID=UPI001AEAA94C|nr:hypothetical protein [Rhizobium leguminosarum]MBP2449928.1 hypothetical protein [Rhizobium leguminosarum]